MKGLGRCLLAGVIMVTGWGLARAVLHVPDAAPALQVQVEANLGDSGVEHPVTAVLLNYRGYDTLLEMLVLLVALIGAWGLSDRGETAALPSSGAVLDEFVSVLVPVLVLVAAYLLWVGAYSPGGAFQGGAVLAGAGVLLSLRDPRWRGPGRLRSAEGLLLAGVAVFTGVGVACLFMGGEFLQYPKPAAGILILLIETAAMLSIGVTLHTLFAGTARVGDDG